MVKGCLAEGGEADARSDQKPSATAAIGQRLEELSTALADGAITVSQLRAAPLEPKESSHCYFDDRECVSRMLGGDLGVRASSPHFLQARSWKLK